MLFLFACIRRGKTTPCLLKTTDVLFFRETCEVSEQTFEKVVAVRNARTFHTFFDVHADCSVICKYGYWLPLEWCCIFLEAGSANSISAIVSAKNGNTNNNSFCFVSVSNAFCSYWVVRLKTQRHMEEFSVIYYFSASIYTEKLLQVITLQLYCLTDLGNRMLFKDNRFQICRVIKHFFLTR